MICPPHIAPGDDIQVNGKHYTVTAVIDDQDEISYKVENIFDLDGPRHRTIQIKPTDNVTVTQSKPLPN